MYKYKVYAHINRCMSFSVCACTHTHQYVKFLMKRLDLA